MIGYYINIIYLHYEQSLGTFFYIHSDLIEYNIKITD